jgi:hypothetical protein
MPYDDRYDQIAVGERARQVRESQGLTQLQWRDRLAAECGIAVDPASLSRIENGRQSLPLAWIPCWARLGKRDPAWLAWGVDPIPDTPTLTVARGHGSAAAARRRPRRS